MTCSYIMLLSWVSFSRSPFVSNPNIAHYLDWLIHSFVIYAALTKTFKDKNTCMLPWQYHNFKDIFEKRNGTIWLWSWVIRRSATTIRTHLWSYINEIFQRTYNIQKSPTCTPMLFKEDIWLSMHVCRLSWRKQNHHLFIFNYH